ncbi:MAG TPA: hypothetical protein VLA13_10075, partial [Massilibacterium sp.]|nr:hypothetical protein [Massilibacterium sp.]
MALKDNYLLEDYEMLTDNLERLHRTFTKALDCATKAEFSSKDEILQSVNESMTMLMALNAKKIQRDNFHSAEA